jgi:hypothetical protein
MKSINHKVHKKRKENKKTIEHLNKRMKNNELS